MIYTKPIPFREALASHAVKSLLPTTGRTRDLQLLESRLKRRALFSATVAVTEPLQRIRDGVDALLRGEADQATVRLGLKQLWETLGYRPDPEQTGTLQDLASTARINLQIETNVATARGAGWYEQGQQPDVLDEFPAQELYDTAPGGQSRRDWHDRWSAAGGKFHDGRMVALKTDPVWDRLGDPELFPDGLGNPYPPFAFHSKWRVRDLDRDEAEQLGLLDAHTRLQPQPLEHEETLRAAADVRDAELRRLVEQSGLGSFDAAGVLHFGPAA